MKPLLALLTSCMLLMGYIGSATVSATETTEKYRVPFAITLPDPVDQAARLGVIVNDADPLSVAAAKYYMQAHHINHRNLIHIELPASDKAPPRRALTPEQARKFVAEVHAKTPSHIQFYLVTFDDPWTAGCMSLTSALAFGYDERYCALGCVLTQKSEYYNSTSRSPYSDHKIRPAMLLPGKNLEEIKRLIDRSIEAYASYPAGTAYLVDTHNPLRNVRAKGYPDIIKLFSQRLKIEHVHTSALKDRDDVLFYFTGLHIVEGIETNHFVPGAVADHLTSTGGILKGGDQMSILRWTEAGAAGSYGTVTEPCNFQQKFPVPAVVMHYYLRGETLIEAYWKSLIMPGQGVFIGDPLTQPFAGVNLTRQNDFVRVRFEALPAGSYNLQGAPTQIGPYRTIGRIKTLKDTIGYTDINLELSHFLYYRLEPSRELHRKAY